jgi:osmotically-inducible protein OsmY
MRPLRTTLIALTVALAACNNTDARTTEGVKERLAREPNPELVDVTTRDRIVTLRGFVDSPAEQQRLESAAREIPGVLGVDNRLGIKRPWRQRMPTSSAACETTM